MYSNKVLMNGRVQVPVGTGRNDFNVGNKKKKIHRARSGEYRGEAKRLLFLLPKRRNIYSLKITFS